MNGTLRCCRCSYFCNHFAFSLSQITKQKKDDAGSTGSQSLSALSLIGAGLSSFLSFSTMAGVDEVEHGLACQAMSKLSMASQGNS